MEKRKMILLIFVNLLLLVGFLTVILAPEAPTDIKSEVIGGIISAWTGELGAVLGYRIASKKGKE